jgi:hypothetical protein
MITYKVSGVKKRNEILAFLLSMRMIGFKKVLQGPKVFSYDTIMFKPVFYAIK